MSKTSIVNIGFGNMVSVSRIIAIIKPNSSPIKKLREEARQRSLLIDATEGKKTRSIIIVDSGQIILSAIQPETLAQRINIGEIID
ncbi:MAG: DUF370 domain-containing protein [Thermodesulfovibrionales bacterium]|nr:DUF370 domain-containing protein [Thermodesulfovibrionales bacterium]